MFKCMVVVQQSQDVVLTNPLFQGELVEMGELYDGNANITFLHDMGEANIFIRVFFYFTSARKCPLPLQNRK